MFGFIKELDRPTAGIPYWILGAMLFIPGTYYMYELGNAFRLLNHIERRQIKNTGL